MNQILTQEEVEALLKAVGADDISPGGDIDPVTGAARNRPGMGRPSGLALISTQTTRFTYSQEKRFEELRPLLEDLTSGMLGGFRNYLISTLEKEFSIERVLMETLNFSDFAQRYDIYGRPFVFTPFTLHPTDRMGLVIFEPGLSIGLVEGFMGGTLEGVPQTMWRGLTPIEIRLTERMCRELIRELEHGWQGHRDVQLRVGATTPNVHMVGRVKELGLAIIVGMRVNLRRNPMGHFYVAIPYSVMEQLHPSRHTEELVELEDDGLAWDNALQNGLMNLMLNFSVQLGGTEMHLRDLLHLEAGHLIPLSSGAPGQATAFLEDTPKFEGVPGVFQGRKAFRVS